MEGYKPQDFSFFHRSEKLVQLDWQDSLTEHAQTIGMDILQITDARGTGQWHQLKLRV